MVVDGGGGHAKMAVAGGRFCARSVSTTE